MVDVVTFLTLLRGSLVRVHDRQEGGPESKRFPNIELNLTISNVNALTNLQCRSIFTLLKLGQGVSGVHTDGGNTVAGSVQAVLRTAISARSSHSMHYLIYVSQAARPMDQDELAEILRGSRIHNDRDDITGLLIYRYSPADKRGNFMQLLEGDEGHVRAAYERIAADRRHHTKIILEEGDAPERNFPDWSMGFQNVEADELAQFEGYSDLGSPDFWARAQAGQLSEPLELMKTFYDSRE